MQTQITKQTFDTGIVKLALLGGVVAATVGLGVAGVQEQHLTMPWSDSTNGSAVVSQAAAPVNGRILEANRIRLQEMNVLPEPATTGAISELQMRHFYEANGVDPDTMTVSASAVTTATGISAREWQLFYEANVLDAVAAEEPTVTWEPMRFLEQNQLPDAGTSATSLSDQVPHHLHFTP